MSAELYRNVCTVVIEGLEPGILLHNPAGMMTQAANRSAAKRIPLPEDEARASCYWTEDESSLAWPAKNLKSGLVAACADWKSPLNKKLALAPLVAGGVSVRPLMIPFGTKEYKVDIQRAIVQRQGVLRCRPLVFPWRLEFDVRWEAQHLGTDFHEVVLAELLARLGQQIGIGDFRPARKGEYGRFNVVSITKARAD
jgi:hypothetical protein